MAQAVTVKVKRLTTHADIPEYSREGDAGLDLVATEVFHNRDFEYVEYGTGISVNMVDICPNLPLKKFTPNERKHTCADTRKLELLGFTCQHSVLKFIECMRR
jgi:hypothetical protein